METPPSNVESNLKAYLIRVFTHIDRLFGERHVLPPTTALPAKPVLGKLYYFPNIILPTIVTAGVWVYKPAGWSYLG